MGRGRQGTARGRGEGDASRSDGNWGVDFDDGGGEDAVGAFIIVAVSNF